jgi:hypothetical protein
MSKRYTINGEEFMWVTPSPWLMNSTMLSGIVQDDTRQLVVSLETGVLTTHKYPKKKIPEDTKIYYKPEEDTFVLLSHDIDEALKRIYTLASPHHYLNGVYGHIIVKGSERMVTYLGNKNNFERAMKQLYKDLAEEA